MLRVLWKRSGLIRFVSCVKGREIHCNTQLRMASEKLAVSQCMHSVCMNILADFGDCFTVFLPAHDAASKEGNRAWKKPVVSDAYTSSSIVQAWMIFMPHTSQGGICCTSYGDESNQPRPGSHSLWSSIIQLAVLMVPVAGHAWLCPSTTLAGCSVRL